MSVAAARSATAGRGADLAPARRAGFLLGVGFGGFVDGIVAHQLLQVHNMVSARIPKTDLANVEVGMFWDGVFHAFTWAVALAGVVALWRAGGGPGRVPGRVLLGAALFGWGVFNVIEGLVDHHLLQVHHVVETLGLSAWDYAFLATGALLALAGFLLARAPGRR